MLAFGKSKLQIFIWRHLSFALPSLHRSIWQSRDVRVPFPFGVSTLFAFGFMCVPFGKFNLIFIFLARAVGFPMNFWECAPGGRARRCLKCATRIFRKLWIQNLKEAQAALSLSLSACYKFLLAVAISIPNFLHNLSNLDKLSPLPLLNLWILYGLLKVFLKTDLSRSRALA